MVQRHLNKIFRAHASSTRHDISFQTLFVSHAHNGSRRDDDRGIGAQVMNLERKVVTIYTSPVTT